MTTIKKNQYLSAYDVRNMCIRENLFTRGTNEQYSYLFDMVNNLPKDCEIDNKHLLAIATYIRMHSDCDEWIRQTGLGINDFDAQIMYLLYEEVTTGFEILDV